MKSDFKLVPAGTFDLELQELLQKKYILALSPATWNTDTMILYVGAKVCSPADWKNFFITHKKQSDVPKSKYFTPARLVAVYYDAHWLFCCTKIPTTAIATTAKASRTHTIKSNLDEIKNLAQFVFPFSKFKVSRNSIIISNKKNSKLCKGGMYGTKQLAHYHKTVPNRICFRPKFLANPLLHENRRCKCCNQQHNRYVMTYDLVYFTLNKSMPRHYPTCSMIVLIDNTAHELAHHLTKDHDDLEFQKKYLKLFYIMINGIISGEYYTFKSTRGKKFV